MFILLIIITAIIVIVSVSDSNKSKDTNQKTSFDIAFTDRLGQGPVSYIRSKLDGGSDLESIRYLFEIMEAEIERKSNTKSPGFDFYYALAGCKEEKKESPVCIREPKVAETVHANKGQRHRWTFEEDVVCCRRFFEQYVLQYSSMDLQFFAQRLHRELPDISVGSLRMKAQNIQQLCREHGIRTSLDAKPLAQYSQQNRRAFMQVKEEFGL